ncbi:hypothetical protein [Candidatus Pelagibacter communis]|uniref:hypothetical protein n=1 Tax=Pelagibacter ubique TaxID=198252 RepID=UPI00065B3AC1|nr:hypothetical protein [Candidatus Pelagibacter ubique]
MEKLKKENKEQIKLIDKITDKALKRVEKEAKKQPRNYINEWFRYVELVNEELKKHLH